MRTYPISSMTLDDALVAVGVLLDLSGASLGGTTARVEQLQPASSPDAARDLLVRFTDAAGQSRDVELHLTATWAQDHDPASLPVRAATPPVGTDPLDAARHLLPRFLLRRSAAGDVTAPAKLVRAALNSARVLEATRHPRRAALLVRAARQLAGLTPGQACTLLQHLTGAEPQLAAPAPDRVWRRPAAGRAA